MPLKNFLKTLDFSISDSELEFLKKRVKDFKDLLERGLKREKTKAGVFIGGSFAKGSLLKDTGYDIDVFVRFEKKEDMGKKLEKVIHSVFSKEKFEIEKIHGSRDYFRLKMKEERDKAYFEVIPVLRVSSPSKAENVTDLSYFHVKYVNKQLKKKDVRKDIALMKKFCQAQGVYGAESYINGISGYGAECLVIHFGSFEKTLKGISKMNEKEIIDPEKWYKNKSEVLVELNESKLESPVVLVDPTWKERNVLAALNGESFSILKGAALKFLKNPGEKYFYREEINEEDLIEKSKKEKSEYIHVEIKTDKQSGDVAGTKLKKFYLYFLKEIEKYFELSLKKFEYGEEDKARVYIIGKSRKEIILEGPPKEMKEAAKAFRKVNKGVYVKSGKLYSKRFLKENLKEFIENWKKDHLKILKEMSITHLEV